MMHIVTRTWNKTNRSDRIRKILEVLNRSGKTEGEYFKQRAYLATLFLGRGHPIPVDEDDNWNCVRISYQEKVAIEIFDSKLGPEGYFFNERFTESENQQIKAAFSEAAFFTWQDYISKNKYTRPLLVLLILVAALGAVRGCTSGNLVNVIAFSGLAVFFLWYLLRR